MIYLNVVRIESSTFENGVDFVAGGQFSSIGGLLVLVLGADALAVLVDVYLKIKKTMLKFF